MPSPVPSPVQRTLVTGMSGVGKSTTVRLLAERGHDAVDLDAPRWSREHEGGWTWRTDAVRDLLASAAGTLVVSGTSEQQGSLYPLLEHVVLLSVPEHVALHRLATRTTNDYGKHPDELARELALRVEVEPLLRAGACLELDTSVLAPDAVADAVLAHAALPTCRGGGTPPTGTDAP